MTYNPKNKPGFFHWLADPIKLLMGGGLLTIIGVLVFFFTESVNPPPSINVPVVNTFPLARTGSASSPAVAQLSPGENPDDPVIPIEEFAVGKPFANHHSSKRLGVFDCPAFPPANYPEVYSMLKIIDNWNPDNTDIPPTHYDSLCHFDFKNKTQLQYAYNYRDQEVPFVVHNMPEINKVVKKWNTDGYLKSFLGNKKYRTETSTNNHFMYWNQASAAFKKTALGKMWKAPTGVTQISYSDWLKGALANHNKTIDSRVHQYFRVSSNSEHEMLFQELPFFKPRKSLYIVDPNGQRGIHCRFGMRSVIAEAHFDSGRNSIVLFGGMRRYILTHPDQCQNMHMLPKRHPSGRHSDVDWSKPDLEKFPNFKKLMGHEVIMAAGDFMYLPQDWIHFIVSLTINFQCNTRSGFCGKYHHHITDCGF